MPNHYETLGIPPDADEAAIKRAYRKRSSESHPDRASGSNEAQQAVNAAYAVLSDPERRARYDAGETEQTPDQSRAQRIIIKHFVAALQESPYTNLVGSVRARIQYLHTDLRDVIGNFQRQRSQLEERGKHLIFKGQGDSLLHSIIEMKIAEITHYLALGEEEQKDMAEALTLLDAYEDTGAPEASTRPSV